MHNNHADPHAALREYDLGTIDQITGTGGTAGKTWHIVASSGEYFLRLRGIRTSTEERLLFDHGLREHLVARGVPTVCAIRTREGARWVRQQGRVYEVYPFVVGHSFSQDNQRENLAPLQSPSPGTSARGRASEQIHFPMKREIVNAAQALARFHQAAKDYEPPVIQEQTVAQFTTLGFSDEVSDRMDDPRLQIINLLGVRELATTLHDKQLVDRCITRIKELEHTYAGAAYERLTGYVIHGDYTPANVLFSQDGQVVGIFDFDWSMFGARCLDVAYGLCFFATQPREIDSSDIWSLTEAVDLALERCVTFLRAYQSAYPLASREIRVIPSALSSLWLSKRLEGMAKVQKHERFRFFSRDIEKPLLWMDANWEYLYQASFNSPGGD